MVGDGFTFRSGLHDNTRNGVVAARAGASEIAEVLDRLADAPAMWLVPAARTQPSSAPHSNAKASGPTGTRPTCMPT